MPSLVVVIALCAAGACLGSFAATAGVRLARGEQALRGRSHCDHCGVGLGFLSTVPIISFARARGACAACGGTIDAVHLFGELAGTAIMVAALALGSSIGSALIVGLGLVLLVSAVVDVKTHRLLDVLTLAVAALCAALALLQSRETLCLGLAAGVIAFVVLEAVRRGFIALRAKEGLGFGDVKLISALAVWLGLATPWAVALAALGGLGVIWLIRPKDGRIAFGPAIAAAGFAVGVAREAGAAPWLL